MNPFQLELSYKVENKPKTNMTEQIVRIQKTAGLMWHLKDALANVRNAKEELEKLEEDPNFKLSKDDRDTIANHKEAIQDLLYKI